MAWLLDLRIIGLQCSCVTAQLSNRPVLRGWPSSCLGQGMGQAWRDLGGRRRTLARMVYARDRATPGYVCPVCAQPIDWLLDWPDPRSRSVDHEAELQDGGALTDLANLWSTHLTCNASKGASRRWKRTRPERSNTSNVIAIDPTTL